MELDVALEGELQQLLNAAARGDLDYLAVRVEKHAGYEIHGFGADALVFTRDWLVRLHRLSDTLAGSALADGVRRRRELATLIVDACRVSKTGHDGLGWLKSHLDSEPRRWRVGCAAAVIMSVPHLPIGRCVVYRNASELPVVCSAGLEREFLEHDYRHAVLLADVEAQDRRSAYWRARDAFHETSAILWLMCAHPSEYGPASGHFMIADDDSFAFTTGRLPSEETLVLHRLDADGQLWPGYRQLGRNEA